MFRRSQILEIIRGNDRSIVAHFLRFVLWLAIPVYWFGWKLKSRRFKNESNIFQASVPVVSIGNITTGGTGKTPLVRWIAKQLLDRGYRPAILSRGYGASNNETQPVNDEYRELKWYLPDVPHLQNPNRVESAKKLIAEKMADILVLDDGFQRRQLGRDLNIVVIDATFPFGAGYLLPRGLLREPLSELKRADFVLINRCNLVQPDQVETIKKTVRGFTSATIQLANTKVAGCVQADGKQLDLSELKNKSIFAFAGIGNPQNFLDLLVRNDLSLSGHRWFPDHYHYQQQDIDELFVESQNAEILICTMKDLVKLEQLETGDRKIVALMIDLEFEGGELADAIGRLTSES